MPKMFSPSKMFLKTWKNRPQKLPNRPKSSPILNSCSIKLLYNDFGFEIFWSLDINRKVSRVVQGGVVFCLFIKWLADLFVRHYTTAKSARTFANTVPPLGRILSMAVQDNFLCCSITGKQHTNLPVYFFPVYFFEYLLNL